MTGCFCTGRCRELGYCPNQRVGELIPGRVQVHPDDPFGPGRMEPHYPTNPFVGPGLVRPKRRLRWSWITKAWVDANLADAISQFTGRAHRDRPDGMG